MSDQEVWITIRIKSSLDMEKDAIEFGKGLANRMLQCLPLKKDQKQFMDDAHEVEVIEVTEERHIYSAECLEDDDKPYKLVEE